MLEVSSGDCCYYASHFHLQDLHFDLQVLERLVLRRGAVWGAYRALGSAQTAHTGWWWRWADTQWDKTQTELASHVSGGSTHWQTMCHVAMAICRLAHPGVTHRGSISGVSLVQELAHSRALISPRWYRGEWVQCQERQQEVQQNTVQYTMTNQHTPQTNTSTVCCQVYTVKQWNNITWWETKWFSCFDL